MKRVLFSSLFLLLFISISSLSFTQTISPVGDDPWNAIVVTELNQCIEITIDPSIYSVTTSVEAPGCGGNTILSENPDVWLLVTVPDNGNLYVSPPNIYNSDPALAVYRFDPLTMSYTMLVCNDDAGPGLMPMVDLTGLVPGEILYLRYWLYHAWDVGSVLSCSSVCNNASLYFADSDGDGYGNANQNGFFLCQATSGYVLNSSDCNDQDSTSHPGAVEFCNNGIDEDCSGSDSICVVLGCTDATASNFNPQANQDDGSCISTLTCNITAPTTTLCAGQSATLTMNTTGGAGASSQLPANLQQGLVAYYPFNGNANDESGNGNNGTVNGATLTSDRFGNVGSAYSFDGVGNFIEVASNSLLNCNSSLTINLYVRNISGNNSEMIIARERYASGISYCLGIENSDYVLSLNNSPLNSVCPQCNKVLTSNGGLDYENWHQITGLWTGSIMSIYIDGVFVSSSNAVLPNNGQLLNSSSPLFIGKWMNLFDPTWGFRFFKGSVDDISIYNRALTPSEIQQLYTAQSYAWSTNATTPTITVSPTTNTTYSCTVTQGNQTCTASVDITVNPAITHAVSATIVEGQSYILGTQTLTTAGTYTEVFTSASGCDSTVTLTLSVEPLLTCNITTPTTTLCAGQSATLTMNTTGGAGASSQLPANLQQGLVAYYPFNGNANDESGNGNNGVVNGATLTSDRFGNVGSAYGFNGGGNYISVPFSQSLAIQGEITYSVWVLLDGGSCNPRVFQVGGCDNPSGSGYLLAFEGNSNQTRNIHIAGVTTCAQGIGFGNVGSSLSALTWANVAFTANFNTGEGKIYFNGQLISINNGTPNLLMNYSGAPLIFGNIAPNRCDWFGGKIDDCFFYNRVLSPSEIQQLYTAQSYAWSNNATTPTITVSPTQNTTYTCTVTQGNSTCTASVDITVNPAITNAISATTVEGQSYTLGTQTLTTAGTYTEVFTSAAGCDSTVTLTLAVEPLLTCNITTPTTTLCAGQSATLTMNTTGGAGASSQLPANLQQGLVAYYPFNGNANDESGNGNNGTVNGATLTSDRFGNVGSAYDFNGNGQNISTGATQVLISEKSFSAWVSLNNINQSGGGVVSIQSPDGQIFDAMVYNEWNSGWMFGSDFFNRSSTSNFLENLANNWVHLVFTYSNYDYKIYRNAQLIFSNTQYPANQFGSDAMILIGLRHYLPQNGYLSGKIDDIGIWNRALSPSEIQQLYSAQSYAWSTNETTPTITVSPTTNTTYSCTVTSGTQTCTASIDITVNPQQTYFADADGDGYGNPDVVVQDCNAPVGYVSDNTDCNDNNALVFFESTEICNGLDDDCDGLIDEGLTVTSIQPITVSTALYPTCSGNALKSANLNNGTNSDLIEGNGLDLWYSLTAQYNTLRASLSAAFGDNEIRLYSYNNGCFELLETEHEVYTTTSLGTGNQVLISDDLIPGQTYYVAVHNISGAMNTSAKMCFNHFVGSTCDHYYSNYTGVYSNVCTSFKAQYKGNATNYIFDVLSATQNNANLNITPWSYTTTSANSIVPRLGTIFPVNMSASAKVYTLQIPVIYAIPDAAGNYTSITANATSTCTVTLNPELPIALRSTDRCPNTKTTSSSISVDRTVCGALRYEWEFTQQFPTVQSPVTVLGGLNTTVFFLNNVPGMGTGKTYNVRVRPIHTNGEVGSWGSVQCLKTGTSGMVLENYPGSAGAVQWANHDSPELGSRYTLYPNPTSTGRFILTANHTSDEEVKSIQMMDITGKVVFQTQVVMNNNTMEIEFGNLASGMYVVMVGEERIRLIVE